MRPRRAPDDGGGYLVCPVAIRENRPEVFGQPIRTSGSQFDRRHRTPQIVEDVKHAAERRAAAKAQQAALFDEGVGRRVPAYALRTMTEWRRA